jgi:hypothetical protein
MSNKVKRLQELRGSGYEVAKGQPDIRGWEVRDANGFLMGKVHELIFDSRANKVRYMVININDSKELQLEKRTVMVPIGLAVLQHQYDDVILPKVTPFQLRALPRYDKNDLGTKAEHAISTVFGRTDTNLAANQTNEDVDESFYNNEMFNEDNMYSRRRNDADNTRYETRHMSEAEAASLRREADMYPDNKNNINKEIRPETEEEYLRRRRRDMNR